MSEEITQVIYDYQTLVEMKNDVTGTYKLGCNIDCSESINTPWEPFDFKGNFIGSGFAICNLNIDGDGFFRKLYGNMSGVGFINCTIKAGSVCGIAAGMICASGNLIERCYVEDCLILPRKNAHYGGGFAGEIRSGTIKECYVANTVIGQEDSTKTQFVDSCGGFAAVITDDLNAINSGLGGSSAVVDCYTQNCTIYVKNVGGGFCARNGYEFKYDPKIAGVKRCYASSRVIIHTPDSKGALKGGFCAVADQTALELQESNFYNLDAFGINNGKGYGFSKMNEQMKDIRTFEDKGWEFSIVKDDGTVIKKTWRIEDGLSFPYLQYNKQYKDILPKSFLKFKDGDNSLYAPLVPYNDINLKGIPHLFIRV